MTKKPRTIMYKILNERFDLFFNMEWWKKYEHILYLDTDVICWTDAPDIFDMYTSKQTFKVCEDRIARKKSASWHEQREKNTILSHVDPEVLRTKRFNAGVFMLNEHSAKIIGDHLKYKEYNDDDSSFSKIISFEDPAFWVEQIFAPNEE